MAEQVEIMKDLLIRIFGAGGEIAVGRAPGRVNLIGEHTDYNDGFVFPMAVDFCILMAARRQVDQVVKIHSADYQKTVEFSLNEPVQYDSNQPWSNYLRGIISVLIEAGVQLGGVELVFQGDIPQGSGLSSSAALEVVTAIILQRLFGFEIEKPQLAKLCQRAENQFVGMNCGIMDQFISMMGEQNRALFLDCRSLEFQNIPLELGDYRILICQSGVKHSLVDSEYNKRRRECEAGVNVLHANFPDIYALRDASMNQLESVKAVLEPVVYRRCRHVIAEDQRVLDSIAALKQGDLKKFGDLMNQSHDSLRDDYEVSCQEIDLLVKLARDIDGVLGSRITGGGFGGCTVTLIQAAAVDSFKRHIVDSYQSQTGITPQIYISTAANGAEILR